MQGLPYPTTTSTITSTSKPSPYTSPFSSTPTTSTTITAQTTVPAPQPPRLYDPNAILIPSALLRVRNTEAGIDPRARSSSQKLIHSGRYSKERRSIRHRPPRFSMPLSPLSRLCVTREVVEEDGWKLAVLSSPPIARHSSDLAAIRPISASDVVLGTKPVNKSKSEDSDEEDSGCLSLGRWKPFTGITNVFAPTPKSTPNMLLQGKYYSDQYLPLPRPS